MDDQDLDQKIDFETVQDSEIRRIYDDGKREVYDSIGKPGSYPPFGLESLRVLYSWFGPVKVCRARKAMDQECKTLDVDKLCWSRESGVYPIGIDIPAPSNLLAWENVKRNYVWI